MARKIINSQHAPQAIGPYDQAVWADGLLFLSGQIPIDPATMKLVESDIGIQTQRVFDNLRAVLSSAGLTFDDVIKVNVYLASMKDFAGMNSIYQTHFNAPYPARSTVAVAGLPLGALVEIELVAKKNQGESL